MDSKQKKLKASTIVIRSNGKIIARATDTYAIGGTKLDKARIGRCLKLAAKLSRFERSLLKSYIDSL